MRVNYCDTVLFLLISSAFQRISASPLPPNNADMLSWNPLDSLVRVEAHEAQIYDQNCLETVDDSGPKHSGADSSPALNEVTTLSLEQYPYPTNTKTSKTTKLRSRTSKSHSSTVPAMMAMSSTARGTLFATTSYAQIASSTHAILSPVKPLYDIGRSSMGTVHSPQINALPWVLGFLIPSLVFLLIWLAIRYRRRCKQQASALHPLPADDSYNSAASTAVEQNDLEIPPEGPYNTSTMLALPPVSIHPLNIGLNVDATTPTAQKAEHMNDRFELKTARFPTPSELSSYIFPSTAAGVEREVRAARRSDTEPYSTSNTRNLMSTRPAGVPTSTRSLATQSRHFAQRPFVSRIQPPQRKRLSPKAAGDVLYSTGGCVLETVHEEPPKLVAENVPESPKAAYKGGHGRFTSGTRDDQALASGSSYTPSSPVGLRARRKSMSLIPEITFSSASPFLEVPGPNSVAPLQIVKSKPLGHGGYTMKPKLLGSTAWMDSDSALGVATEMATAAEEEERKFAQFVRELVRSQDAHAARRRKHHRQASISTSAQSSSQTSVASIYTLREPSYKIDGEDEEGPLLLPAPSIGATLSDFAVSSSTLASESMREHETLPLSFSRLSIGVAL